MKRIPRYWKILREALRICRQTLELPPEVARKIYFRRWHDTFGSTQIRKSTGVLTLQREIGIYLIFPVSGVLNSHLYVVDEMRRAGITPVIVSNLPLSSEDRDRLLQRSAWVMERPNIGYDFGGYRDAILTLQDSLTGLERLWILNDSTWMISQPVNWFEAARALNADFVGATSHHGLPRAHLEDFRSVRWHFDTGREKFHYGSYAWSIGPAILKDAGFIRFWKSLDIRNDKRRTVRRGEVGLTKWVLKHGFSHAATWEVDRLDTELAALPDDEIQRILGDVILREDRRLVAPKAELLEGGSRADKITFILAAVSRQAGAYALPGYGHSMKGYQFLKKGTGSISIESRQITMDLIRRLPAAEASSILEEAKTLYGTGDEAFEART